MSDLSELSHQSKTASLNRPNIFKLQPAGIIVLKNAEIVLLRLRRIINKGWVGQGASMQNDQLQHSYFHKILSGAIRSCFVSSTGALSGELCITELHTHALLLFKDLTHRAKQCFLFAPPINLPITPHGTVFNIQNETLRAHILYLAELPWTWTVLKW